MSTITGTVVKLDCEDTYTIEWTTPNFPSFLEIAKPFADFFAEVDIEDSRQDIKFRLRMKIDGRKKNFVDIYFQTLSNSNSSFYMKTLLYLVNVHTRQKDNLKISTKLIIHSNKWNFLHRLTKESIKNNCSEFIYDCHLGLLFEFAVPNVNFERPIATNPQLNNNLNSLYESSLYSDVTIVSKDGVQFKSHKLVLACRSNMFKGMFSHNMIEDQTNTLKSHLDSTVLGEVLKYIYTDNCALITSIPSELLAAADFYQLDGLKSLSEQAIVPTLTADNAVELLVLAERYSPKLQQAVLEYIKNGKAKEIMKSEAWKNISSDVIKKIYEFIHKDDPSVLTATKE